MCTTIMDLLRANLKLLLVLLSHVLLCQAQFSTNFVEMKFAVEPADTVAKPGQPAMLGCSATYNGSAPSIYSWRRNDVLLSAWVSRGSAQKAMFFFPNGSLYFPIVSSSHVSMHVGVYKCIAEKPVGTRVHRIVTPPARLSVEVQPRMVIQPLSLSLRPGETAMFRCLAQGSPQVTYSWIKNGTPIYSSGNVLISEGVLQIRDVAASDQGRYRCRAGNSAGDVTSSSVSLVVKSQDLMGTTLPMLDLSEAEEGGVGGDNSSSVLSSLFSFFGFGGGSEDEKSTAAPTLPLDETLTTFPMWLIANFSLGTTTAKGSVYNSTSTSTTPTPPPRVIHRVSQQTPGIGFVMKPWDTVAVAGSTAVLFCAVNGTDERRSVPTVTWLKSGSTVDTTSSGSRFSITGSASLQIENVTVDDDGVYTCRGENLFEVADGAATLSVRVPPYFKIAPQNTYGRVNEDIILRCEAGGIPAPKVTWYKDSDVVMESPYFRHMGSDLKILGLMPTDAAYYQCMAGNELGYVHAVAQLIVLDSEVEMSSITVSSFTASSTDSPQAHDSSLPPTPANLWGAMVSQTFVALTWSMNLPPGAPPVTKYTVTTRQHVTARLRTVNVTSQDYTVEGLLPDSEYTFSVRAYNRNGVSATPAEITVRTEKEVAVPEVVRNLKAEATSHESIAITWNRPAVIHGAVIFYRVYYSSRSQRELYRRFNGTSATLLDLHPYTEYYIRVVAINENGAGTPSEDLTIRTFSSRPTGAPTNITVEPSGTSSIVVRWMPPFHQQQNGVITGYKIRSKLKSSRDGRATPHTTDADARSFEITGLETDKTYVVKIAAMNANGSGDFSSRYEATTYAVELDESRPPARPAYIQLKAFAREMIVSWGPTENSDEVAVRGFRIGYGIGIPEQHWVENIPPSTRIYSLNNLSPKKNYVVKVIAFNDAGSGPSAEQTATTSESLRPNSEIMPPVAVKVRPISSSSVLVTWYDSTLGVNQRPLDGRIYTVQYNALSGSAQRKTQFRNTTEVFMRVDGLRPYTRYEFSVRVSKGDRFSVFSLAVRNSTLEDKPGTAPRDLTMTLLHRKPNMLSISWQPPSNPNGRILHYTIYSNTNYEESLDNWVDEEVSGDTLNHEFGPVTPSTLYFFRMSATNSKGSSAPSATTTLRTPELKDFPSHTSDLSSEFRGQDGGPGAPKEPKGVTLSPSAQDGVPSAQTLWIIIACVSAVTAVAIAALVAVLCRRKIINDKRKPANLKATNQAPKGMNKSKQNTGNLWINHAEVEMKVLHKDADPQEVDETTSMLHSHGSQFDVTSASVMGDGYAHIDEPPRYCTLGRHRPAQVGMTPYQQREDGGCYGLPAHNPYSTMPRATVQPMNVDSSRPLYPRTQFATHNPNVPRVHLGDTLQPMNETSSFCTDPLVGLSGVPPPLSDDCTSGVNTPVPSGFTNGELESFNALTSTPHYNQPYGEDYPPPRPPPMEGRPYPLKSFNATNGIGHSIPKHIVKPQPISAFKPAIPPPSELGCEDTDSLKRPPRPPYINRQISQGSLGRDTLKMSLRTGSTEELNTDMAKLDDIMQNLNSMKGDFQSVA